MTTQENRGLFLMLPDCLLDDDTLSGNCIIGFARLMRYCQQQRSNVFTGSLKKLARITKLPKSTVRFFIPQWEERHLLTKDEDEDGIMTLTLHLSELWQENVTYCAPMMSTIAKPDSTIAKPDSTTTAQIAQPVNTNEGTKREDYEEKEEGKDMNLTPSSFESQHLQEPVTTETHHASDKPSMNRGSFLPSSSKTFHMQESKKQLHLLPKTPPSFQEIKPPTRRELEQQQEQEREAYWQLAETILKKPYPKYFRERPMNVKGLDILLTSGETLERIQFGLEHLTASEAGRFNWTYFLEWLPNKFSPPGQDKKEQVYPPPMKDEAQHLGDHTTYYPGLGRVRNATAERLGKVQVLS